MHTLDVHNGRYFIQISLNFGMLTILLIIKSCTKINQLKLQTQCNLKVAENHEIVDIWPFRRFLMNLGVASRVQNYIRMDLTQFLHGDWSKFNLKVHISLSLVLQLILL